VSGRLSRSAVQADARAQDVHVRMPLLDRLLDDNPAETRDPPISASQAHNELVRAVRRDLEALLNARRPWRSLPDGYESLEQSPMGFGLSDFAAGAFNAESRRTQLRDELRAAVSRFEKRLTDVAVDLSGASLIDATLRLRIHAQLNAEPVVTPIRFDTEVHATTSDIDIRQTRDV
jgi:type VI secretion system protein ImpF